MQIVDTQPPTGRSRLDLRGPEELGELTRIAVDALRFFPPLYVDSIFGHPWTWLPPHRRHSEFRILDPWKLRQSVLWLVYVSLPGFARTPFEILPGTLNPLFWRPSKVFPFPDGPCDPAFDDETWFYINGVATDETVARLNARYLFELFRRPMTVVHNATNSLGVDLLECAVGKSWQIMSEPARKAFPKILAALNDPAKDRVVVVCHSQGTIIMANVLRALVDGRFRDRLFVLPDGSRETVTWPGHLERRTDLRKLEIYAFANCADVMTHAAGPYSTDRADRVPWIESFGNEYDLVARLGMLAPHKDRHGIRIDGTSWVRSGAWGHLLNEHYLRPIERHLAAPDRVPDPFRVEPGTSSSSRPRLYDFYGGGRPEAY